MSDRKESRASLVRFIRKNWSAIAGAAWLKGAGRAASAILPLVNVRLLGESIKTDAGNGQGYKTAILYLSPATESGRNTCPWASEGCALACLKGSGQLSMQENARLWKTALYFGDRETFLALLALEVASHEQSALRAGKVPALRLDGTSDLGLARRFAARFPGVRWYDYTKSEKRALESLAPGSARSVTFSYSGENDAAAARVLQAGGNVAVAFDALPKIRGKYGREAEALPATWRGFPVIDGDLTDLRFLDPKGVVVGLRFKASANRAERLKAAGAFVQPVTPAPVKARGRRLALAV